MTDIFPSDPDPVFPSAHMDQVETIYYGASERNKARFALALLALVRLGGLNTKYTRKEIFSPIGNLKKKEPKALMDEGMSKDWQRKFLDRLNKDDLIHIVGNYISSPEDGQKQRLYEIAVNAISDDGLLLKAMLWPSQYTDAMPAPQEVEAHEVSQEMVQSEKSSDFDGVKEIVDRLEGVQTYLKTMVDHLGQIYRSLDGLNTKMEITVANAESSTEDIVKVLAILRNDNIAKLTTIADRLVENGTRRKTLISQLTSDANAEGKLGEDLNKMLNVLKETDRG